MRGLLTKPWYVVGLLASLGLVSIIDRIALNLLIEPLKQDLNISDTQVGLLIGPTFALVYTFAAFPIAWGLDRGNRKWIAVGGISLWSLSTMASAFVSSFDTLFLLRMGVGIGEAVLNPVAVSLIGDLFHRDRRATPTSVYISAQTLGGSMSFLLVASIVAMWSSNIFGVSSDLASVAPWRVALFLFGTPGLLLAVLMAWSFREPERGRLDGLHGETVSEPPPSAFVSTRAALRFYVPFLLGVNLVGMMQIISVSWIPSYLIRTHHAPISQVGFLFGNALLVACIGTLAGPVLAQKAALNGRKDAIFLVFAISIPGAFLAMLGALTLISLVWAAVLVALFHTFTNSVIVMPSVVISSIGATRARARLVAVHLFVQAMLAYTLGPVLVPMLARYFFDELLGPAIITVTLGALPLACFFLFLAWRPYRDVVYGRVPTSEPRQDSAPRAA
jgi:MFS family permease